MRGHTSVLKEPVNEFSTTFYGTSQSNLKFELINVRGFDVTLMCNTRVKDEIKVHT